MSQAIKTYWPIAAIILIALIITTRLMAPPPPNVISFASGSEGGAYTLTAQTYQTRFAAENIDMQIATTSGSGENLELLRAGTADAAILQGGMAGPADAEILTSLGAIFFEPLWVFHTADIAPADLRDLSGLRIAAGVQGSGTRALSEEILRSNGVQAELIDLSGRSGAEAMLAGDVDALMTVSAPHAPYIRELLADENVSVLSFDRALAYERRTPYLKHVTFPEGGLDLQANLPAQPIELVAPAAQVVVRNDVHPALQSLLIEAMVQAHRSGTLLSEPGAFPTPGRVDLPLSEEAARYYESGPSFLRRYFPFGVANFLERAWVLAIPLLTLAFPLVKAAPPIYRWRTRRKIYIWYKDLRDLEARGRRAKSTQDRLKVSSELGALQAEVGRVEVPESYNDELYRLRSHILFVQQLLVRLESKSEVESDENVIPAAS